VGAAQDAQRDQPSAKSEERIIKQVRHELLMLPYFGVFDNLSYKVEGYKVTLMGQVVRPVTKSDAENAVKHIEGVKKVDDQIEVLPPSPMDDGFAAACFAPSTAILRCRDMGWETRSPSALSSRAAT
jgi:hyperosmotically inducible protein